MNQTRQFSAPAQDCSPLALPRVGQAWVRLGNAVLRAGVSLPVNLGGERWQWQPLPFLLAEAPRTWACTLHCAVDGEPLTCWLSSLLPLAVPPVTEDDLHILPPALATAALHAAAGHLLDALTRYLGQRCTLEGFSLEPEEALFLDEGLPFVLENDTRRVCGLLAGDISHPLFAALQAIAEQDAPPRPLPHLVLPCPVRWRTRPLPLNQIRSLETGDVLLLPAGTATDVPVRLTAGTGAEHPAHSFRARWNAENHTVTLESCMLEDIEDSAEGIELSATLEECAVPVECTLGQVSLSLADLSALTPGTVLGPLSTTDAPVTLRVGSAVIGRGALVDIDGRVGIRVTTVRFPQSTPTEDDTL